jgi:Xaa-Pro aminopeptidase
MTTALFVTNPTNIRYLTGFVGVDPRDAYGVYTPEKTYFFTNSLYMEQTRNLSPILLTREHPISAALKKLCKKLNIQELAFEESDLTVAEYNTLKKELLDVALIPSQNRIEQMRMIKTAEEIANIRTAAKITDECFKHILGRIRPGITEARLSWEIEGFLRFKGGALAFAPIVAFNTHSSQPHYDAKGNDPLRRGSLILLDFGARVNGYCADMTRVVFLGAPKPEWKKAYETVLAANERAIALLQNGERDGKILDQEAQKISTYPHSLGHAVGLDIHEGPRLTMKKSAILKPSMVVTVEPGMYIEGQYGIRIEDLVLLKSNTVEILSKTKKELTIL